MEKTSLQYCVEFDMEPIEKDEIVVVSIIPYAPRTEAFIEYEPCLPSKSISPYCTGLYSTVYTFSRLFFLGLIVLYSRVPPPV